MQIKRNERVFVVVLLILRILLSLLRLRIILSPLLLLMPTLSVLKLCPKVPTWDPKVRHSGSEIRYLSGAV